MSIFHDIRNQPHHIRRIMFGLSLTVVVLGFGMVWINSFGKEMYALLNPQPGSVDPGSALAGATASASSPFALIGKAFGDLRASIADIFETSAGTTPTPKPEPARTLPISAPK